MNVDTSEFRALTARVTVLEARVGALSDGLALAGRATGVEPVPRPPRRGGRPARPRPPYLRPVRSDDR